MKQYEILCGGASPRAGVAEDKLIQMDVQGSARNVNLKIEDITRAMVSNIPDVLLDLLEVAAYVYCADQRLSRGSDRLTDYGSDWRRHMRFTIPLRQPDLWNSPAVHDALCDTLGFLADETYSFTFVKADKPLAEKSLYFSELTDGTFVPDDVAMFSGGLDSFAGTVWDLVENGKKLVLVGHQSASKVVSVQKELVEGLKQRGLGGKIFYIPVNVTNAGVTARDYTQRTRSFLFACLGLVVARMFGLDRFSFYENGVVGINIPIAKDVLGARATRTTHPKVVRGFEAIFSALLDREIEIMMPLQWLTKKEVVAKVVGTNFVHLLGATMSCTRPMQASRSKPHCGRCSQCIDRRFAILAAGMEARDPAERYRVDLLTGDRSDDTDIRMAVAYVKCFQSLASSQEGRFLADYPEVTSALAHFPDLTTDEARRHVYDLFQRHAKDVLWVIAEGTRRHMDELVRGELPAGSLLSMCFNRSRIETPQPSDYDRQVKEFMDRLEQPKCEFATDLDGRRILFKGGFQLEGANFKLVEALLHNFRAGKATGTDISYIPAPELALKLGIEEDSLRQQVRRLRKLVTDRLAVGLGVVLGSDDFVENKERAGYRLSPGLREVARADVERSLR